MTSPSTSSRALVAGLAATALALALTACGGGSEAAPAASSAAAPASSAAAPSSSAPAESPSESAAASPSASESSSASSGSADVAKVCDVLDADKIKDLTGVSVKKGASQDLGSSNICQWTPTDTTDVDAAIFSGQEGPLPGDLSQVEGELKKQFDGSVTKISIKGADDARFVKGKKSGVNVIDVIAAKGGVFYQVIAATPRDIDRHKDGTIKVAEALIKG